MCSTSLAHAIIYYGSVGIFTYTERMLWDLVRNHAANEIQSSDPSSAACKMELKKHDQSITTIIKLHKRTQTFFYFSSRVTCANYSDGPFILLWRNELKAFWAT